MSFFSGRGANSRNLGPIFLTIFVRSKVTLNQFEELMVTYMFLLYLSQVLDCLDVDSGEGVKFSTETLFVPDKYDIV